MHNRTDCGWVRAGLAVLVTGILGGGVLAVVGGPDESRKVTADGVATGQPAEATPLQSAPLEGPSPGRDTPEVGDKVLMGEDGGSVTVSAVEEDVSAGRLFGAGEGSKYVAAEVKGCSGPNERNVTFEAAYFLLRLDDGTIRDPGPGAKKPSLEGGTIPAGRCLSGWVTFVVPDGARPSAVIYDGSARTTWALPRPEDDDPTTTTTERSPVATTATTGGADGPEVTSTTRSKASTTTTTAKSTGTTAATTTSTVGSSSTTSTGGQGTSSSTATTETTGATTETTGATTSTTGKPATSTTTPAEGSSTTTTGPGVAPDPAGSEG